MPNKFKTIEDELTWGFCPRDYLLDKNGSLSSKISGALIWAVKKQKIKKNKKIMEQIVKKSSKLFKEGRNE